MIYFIVKLKDEFRLIVKKQHIQRYLPNNTKNPSKVADKYMLYASI